MAEVLLDVGGRRYAVACKDGGEVHLLDIAAKVDARAQDALRAVGSATEVRTLLLSALLLADELQEALQPKAVAPSPETPIFDGRLAASLAALAERVESLADGLEAERNNP